MELLSEIEKACGQLAGSASYANNLDVTITDGRTGNELELPYVVCAAEQAEQAIMDTALYYAKVSIQVAERAQDTDVTSSLAPVVFGAFRQSDVIQKLIAYGSGSICIYRITGKPEFTNGVNPADKTMIQSMNFELLAGLQN